MKKFSELGICAPIMKVIEELGFDKPTEIQERSIPSILSGQDVIGGSATGSGKTLAFATGIIQNLEPNGKVQAIVLAPTRELAEQVKDSIIKFSKYKKLHTAAIYGGVSINPQIEELQHTDVVVGTPGRVLDHLSRGTLDLRQIKIVVLDEADRMLDMGFIDDVNQIISQCPRQRQTLLYSATISDEIYNIAKNHMNNPLKVSVEQFVDPRKLRQVYYQVPQNMKFSLLVHLLEQERSGLAMVFCNTQRMTDFVARNLQKQGMNAIPIHGGLSQAKRSRTMESFHSGKKDILVCTDVAARGLHVEGVTHIYNYDIPKESKQYIHRIGRTARAGHEGLAINLLSERDYENFGFVLRDNGLEIPLAEMPYVKKIHVQSYHNRGYSGRNRNGNRGHRQGGNSRSWGVHKQVRTRSRY